MKQFLSNCSQFFLSLSKLCDSVRCALITGELTADQWANRLSDYCLDEIYVTRYWQIIEAGIEPAHAFHMVAKERL